MQAVEASINQDRTKPFSLNAYYYFIDKKKDFVSFLRNRINEYGFGNLLSNQRCQCIVGDFSLIVDDVIADLRKKGHGKRSIFLLDQYGYIDATLPLLRKIFLNVPGAEIIVTFAADKLIDFYNKSEKYEAMMRKLGIDPKKCDVSTERGQMEWRYQMQSRIAEEIFKESGAKFFTRFFIVSKKSNRAYWLLHFSNHLRAHDEMVRIHWQVKNHFAHYGGAGLNAFPILGYDPDKSLVKEFDFGSDAKSLSYNALMNDLPRYIYRFTDGITVGNLRTATANHTPTDMALCREALGRLRADMDIIIKTKNGGERRTASGIDLDDLIVPNRQLKLILPPGVKKPNP